MSRDPFSIVEYQEATSAYFKGVEIGINIMKLFFFINAVLFTGLLTCLKIISDGSRFQILLYTSVIICFIGLTASILIFFLVKLYNKQLENCAFRAIELEKNNGAKLFSRIQATSESPFNSTHLLYIVAFVISLIWIAAIQQTAQLLLF